MARHSSSDSLIPVERIESKIYQIRDKKVMLDHDLSSLYEVPTKALKQAVKRNIDRFPDDFMFVLTKKETQNWRSQIVTSNSRFKMGLRYSPFAFTEQGVAMLSSVLNSRTAIQVNIQIIRTFVRMKEVVLSHKDLWIKIEQIEKKYDAQFQVVFKAIKLLLDKSKGGPEKRF